MEVRSRACSKVSDVNYNIYCHAMLQGHTLRAHALASQRELYSWYLHARDAALLTFELSQQSCGSCVVTPRYTIATTSKYLGAKDEKKTCIVKKNEKRKSC